MMNYNSILENKWLRLTFGLLAGFLIELPVDNILALMYRNYSVVSSNYDFFVVIGFSTLCFQLFYFAIKKIEKHFDWNTNTRKRFIVQLLVHWLIAILFFIIPKYLIERVFNIISFYILNIEIVTITAILFIVFLYNLFELGFFLLRKWRFSLAELERFKKENVEFRFETLKNQVNPHFLFNSLNTLSSLIYENQDIAAQYIRELSKVYRYVLENRDKEMVILRTDFDFIQSFIYLYELRFTNMLNFEIDIAADKFDYFIAPMTIQMLIENAAKHNIVSRKKPLTISIKTEDEYLIVTNNLQKKQQKEYSSGMGLKNIKSRYSFLTHAEVEIIETDEIFAVKIPLIKK